jgi:hypothetical protein
VPVADAVQLEAGTQLLVVLPGVLVPLLDPLPPLLLELLPLVLVDQTNLTYC